MKKLVVLVLVLSLFLAGCQGFKDGIKDGYEEGKNGSSKVEDVSLLEFQYCVKANMLINRFCEEMDDLLTIIELIWVPTRNEDLADAIKIANKTIEDINKLKAPSDRIQEQHIVLTGALKELQKIFEGLPTAVKHHDTRRLGKFFDDIVSYGYIIGTVSGKLDMILAELD